MRLSKLRWFSVEIVRTNRSPVEFAVIRSWKALAGCRCARGGCHAGLGEPVRSLVRSELLRLRFMWVDLGGYRMHKTRHWWPGCASAMKTPKSAAAGSSLALLGVINGVATTWDAALALGPGSPQSLLDDDFAESRIDAGALIDDDLYPAQRPSCEGDLGGRCAAILEGAKRNVGGAIREF